MKTNIVIALDTRRPKSDGTYPLILRLGHHRKTVPISLGISLKEKDWDEKNKVIKKTYLGVESVTRLNNSIQKKRSEAMDAILKLSDSEQLDALSVAEIKDRIFKESTNNSFFQFAEQCIDELKKANRFGTARSYKGIVSVLKEFNKNKDLYFKDITYKYLIRFETSHAERGNSLNGLSVYIRGIRAIYNKAIKSGIVEKELYPFQDYKIKSIPTEKRALEWEHLKKIIALDLTFDHPCFNSRNYFVASYMMYGMNFSDMAFIKKTDIKNGRLQYRRKKTNKIYDIKITDSLNKILSYYSTRTIDSEYLFPIIKRASLVDQDKDILWARKRYNKKLKAIAKECGIESNLTSYVSRHSFATQAMLHNVPLNAISTMLGHSNLKTTEIYLESLPTTTLDEYNKKLLHEEM